jgi:hypothetical protein
VKISHLYSCETGIILLKLREEVVEDAKEEEKNQKFVALDS